MSEYTEQFIRLERLTKSKAYGVRLTPQLESRLLDEISLNGDSVQSILSKALSLYFYIKDYKTDVIHDDTVINILIDKNTKNLI